MGTKGAHIVLGVTGSIAAYKACSIVRGLIRRGCEVRVVMTEASMHLVGASTFCSLSGNPVASGLWAAGDRTELAHIKLADWAHLLAVAPATANIIGKFACGIADDMLSTLWLAFDGEKVIAPAMNDRMWANELVQRNVETLKGLQNVHFIPPVAGALACGDKDRAGRLAPVEDVVGEICRLAAR